MFALSTPVKRQREEVDESSAAKRQAFNGMLSFSGAHAAQSYGGDMAMDGMDAEGGAGSDPSHAWGGESARRMLHSASDASLATTYAESSAPATPSDYSFGEQLNQGGTYGFPAQANIHQVGAFAQNGHAFSDPTSASHYGHDMSMMGNGCGAPQTPISIYPSSATGETAEGTAFAAYALQNGMPATGVVENGFRYGPNGVRELDSPMYNYLTATYGRPSLLQ